MTARFLNAAGAVLGSNVVGRVTAAERGGVTGLSLRSTNGALPVGTRFVEFTLTNRVVTGMNDASADNLSFVLTPHPLPPFSNTAHGPAGNVWQVEFTGRTNRLYVLERSEDFAAWTEVTPPAARLRPGHRAGGHERPGRADVLSRRLPVAVTP
ncbi:MAG: hypothetical protein EXS33_03785 [Pedosphaera sp.]|nr:hypothetical protein [Pedosphaera sp.]